MRNIFFVFLFLTVTPVFAAITPEYLFRIPTSVAKHSETWVLVIGKDQKETLVQKYTVYIGPIGNMTAHNVEYAEQKNDDTFFFYFTDGGELEVTPDWNWDKNPPVLNSGSYSNVKLLVNHNAQLRSMTLAQLSKLIGKNLRGPIRSCTEVLAK